jgi:vacuolar-type H+-ATPase subunit B/Vma2
LPEEELTKIRREYIEKYHPKYKKKKAEGEGEAS